MFQTDYRNLFLMVEQATQQVVRSAYPRYWKEDYITQSLLAALITRLGSASVIASDRPFTIEVDAFKAHGKLEQTRGDIAVIVRRTSWEDEELTGIGFLEAKRRYPNTGEYTALDFTQLDRIHDGTDNLQILLYDFELIVGFAENLGIPSHLHPLGTGPSAPFTHALTVPAGLVRTLKKRTKSLH